MGGEILELESERIKRVTTNEMLSLFEAIKNGNTTEESLRSMGFNEETIKKALKIMGV